MCGPLTRQRRQSKSPARSERAAPPSRRVLRAGRGSPARRSRRSRRRRRRLPPATTDATIGHDGVAGIRSVGSVGRFAHLDRVDGIACDRRARGHRVSRSGLSPRWWLSRRRSLLRHQRLSHHVAPPRRAREDAGAPVALGSLLASPRAPPLARAHRALARRRRALDDDRPRRIPRYEERSAQRSLLRQQLVADLPPSLVPHGGGSSAAPPASLVARDRGAILFRLADRLRVPRPQAPRDLARRGRRDPRVRVVRVDGEPLRSHERRLRHLLPDGHARQWPPLRDGARGGVVAVARPLGIGRPPRPARRHRGGGVARAPRASERIRPW